MGFYKLSTLAKLARSLLVLSVVFVLFLSFVTFSNPFSVSYAASAVKVNAISCIEGRDTILVKIAYTIPNGSIKVSTDNKGQLIATAYDYSPRYGSPYSNFLNSCKLVKVSPPLLDEKAGFKVKLKINRPNGMGIYAVDTDTKNQNIKIMFKKNATWQPGTTFINKNGSRYANYNRTNFGLKRDPDIHERIDEIKKSSSGASTDNTGINVNSAKAEKTFMNAKEEGKIVAQKLYDKVSAIVKEYDSTGIISHTINKATKAVKRASCINNIVMIDAGHGGVNLGTRYTGIIKSPLAHSTHPYSKYKFEKEVTLRFAKLVGAKLVDLGLNVIFVRTTDVNITRSDRVDLFDAHKPAFFLSIHAGTKRKCTSFGGIKVITYNKEEELCQTVYPGSKFDRTSYGSRFATFLQSNGVKFAYSNLTNTEFTEPDSHTDIISNISEGVMLDLGCIVTLPEKSINELANAVAVSIAKIVIKP